MQTNGNSVSYTWSEWELAALYTRATGYMSTRPLYEEPWWPQLQALRKRIYHEMLEDAVLRQMTGGAAHARPLAPPAETPAPGGDPETGDGSQSDAGSGEDCNTDG